MTSLKNNFCTIEEVQWKDIKNSVKEKNPTLFHLIEAIKPSAQLTFIRARYGYGIKIIDNGIFQLPTLDGRYASLEDTQIPDSIRQKLNYCSIPLAVVLHNDSEVLIEQPDRIIPLNYFVPGDLFGLFEIVDLLRGKISTPKWTVTSGARSLFMLPKITDSNRYGKIKKKYHLQTDIPNNLYEQWNVFRDLTQNNGESKQWYNEILFFTQAWFDQSRQTNKDFNRFYRYLLEYSLDQLDYLRVYSELNFLWTPFTASLSYKGLKPRPYLMNTVKHLISIVNGTAFGFRPVMDNATGPITLLQQIFLQDYGIDYHPLFMRLYKWKEGNLDKPIYYSLNVPIILEGTPYTRNPTNIIDDQRDIQRLLKIIQEIATSSEEIKYYSKTLFFFLNRVKFEYFHCTPDIHSNIQDSKEIPTSDSDFMPPLNPLDQKRKFCSNSQFMKGCIKISMVLT